MALIRVVQDRFTMAPNELFPNHTHRNHSGTQLGADGFISIRNLLLSFRSILPGPGEVQCGLCSTGLDRSIKEPDIFVHAIRILDWQRALFLQHDEVIALPLHFLLSGTLVPVHPKRSTACRNEPALAPQAPRFRQLRKECGNVVPGGEAVSDEENSCHRTIYPPNCDPNLTAKHKGGLKPLRIEN